MTVGMWPVQSVCPLAAVQTEWWCAIVVVLVWCDRVAAVVYWVYCTSCQSTVSLAVFRMSLLALLAPSLVALAIDAGGTNLTLLPNGTAGRCMDGSPGGYYLASNTSSKVLVQPRETTRAHLALFSLSPLAPLASGATHVHSTHLLHSTHSTHSTHSIHSLHSLFQGVGDQLGRRGGMRLSSKLRRAPWQSSVLIKVG
jgi:hypothetical protein